MKIFGTWLIFYPACLKVNLRPNWKRHTLSYAASQLLSGCRELVINTVAINVLRSLSLARFTEKIQVQRLVHSHKVGSTCKWL